MELGVRFCWKLKIPCQVCGYLLPRLGRHENFSSIFDLFPRDLLRPVQIPPETRKNSKRSTRRKKGQLYLFTIPSYYRKKNFRRGREAVPNCDEVQRFDDVLKLFR